LFKSRFKEVLDPYGFRTSQGTFYRVTSDVVQAVRLQKTKYDCTVEFGIWPLFDVIDDLSNWRGYEISKLRDGQMKGWDWQFTPFTEHSADENQVMKTIVVNDGSVEDIVKDMLSVFIKHVLPLFEKATEFRAASKIVREHEYSVYGKELSEISDKRRYWWYILVGDYEKAIQGIKAVISELQPSNSSRFTKASMIETSKKELSIFKLKYELVRSSNYEKTKADMLSREGVDAEFIECLLSNERVLRDYETTSYIRHQIRDLEKHLKQAENHESPWSKELDEIEALHIAKEKNLLEKVMQLQKEMNLLYARDIEYFQRIIEKNEAKSREYFNNPSVFKHSR